MRISVGVTLIWILGFIRLSNQADKQSLQQSLLDSGVYDCRFWQQPKQEVARIIIDNRIDSEASVFYFWDTARNECLPCSVCPERTLSLCWYVKDTECISQKEWLQQNLSNRGKMMLSSGRGSPFRYQTDADNDRQSDGVVVFRSASDANTEKQPTVFGVPVYSTDDADQSAKDTPTRKVHRKYSQNSNYLTNDASMPEEEMYGTPTFFSKDESAAEIIHHNPIKHEARPILTILHEILENNKSQGLSVKDVANITKTRSNNHYGYNPIDISGYFKKEETKQVPTTVSSLQPKHPLVYKHTEYTHHSSSFKPQSIHSTSKPSVVHTNEDQFDSLDYRDYNDRFKQIWPYRTDDKYSLFYFHPKTNQPSVDDSQVYPWPSLMDTDEEYHQEDADDIFNPNKEEKSSSSTQRALIPLLPEDEYFSSDGENTQYLEHIFISVAALVVVLVIILICLTSRSRSNQNRFKLLDNSDNISSYHSVSPADTIIPPCHVPGTRSPSPLPSSRRTSCVSSSSTSASYPGSCPGPSQASGNRHEYDRTKLSIPLQRYNISSPSSGSPLAKSPSSFDQNLIHPSVARSLRNIKQTANEEIQHIELDLNGKLF